MLCFAGRGGVRLAAEAAAMRYVKEGREVKVDWKRGMWCNEGVRCMCFRALLDRAVLAAVIAAAIEGGGVLWY